MRKTKRRSQALAFIAILLFSSALFVAQDKIQNKLQDKVPVDIKTRVDLVPVPVSARDRNGSLVTSLEKDDFTILEDGKPQSIASFSNDPQPLSAVLVVDTGMSGSELHRLTPLIGTLSHEFQEADEVAVYRYDHLVTKLVDFTNNQLAVEKSLDAVRQIADAKTEDSETGRTIGPSPLRWILDRTSVGTNGAPANAGAPQTTTTPTTQPRSAMPSKILHDAVFAASMDLRKRAKDHRKIVILISDGQVIGDNEHSVGETNELLLASDIQFYAVSPNTKILERAAVLNSYARSTGGSVFDGGTIDTVAQAFAQLVDQARNQYVLGYYSTNEVPGTRPVFRKINIKTRDSKLRIVHRQGYTQYPS
jgi:VWFA-related protein